MNYSNHKQGMPVIFSIIIGLFGAVTVIGYSMNFHDNDRSLLYIILGICIMIGSLRQIYQLKSKGKEK